MQRFIIRLLLRALAAAFLPIVAAVAADDRPSLCTPAETAIFSCAVGGKIVSLCGSRDLSATAGSMTYRYGRKGAIELTYPETPAHPREAFTAAVVGMSAGGGDFVRFVRSDVTYTLYALIFRGVGEDDGLVISRAGKTISKRKCKDYALGAGAWGAMYQAKLPADPGQSIEPE